MRNMLLQYYFRNLESQLLVIPVFSFIFIGISLLFEQSSFVFSTSLIVSVSIITMLFVQLCQRNEKMFAIMPIPKKELVQAKFIFLICTTCVYATLFFTGYILLILIQEDWSWSGWAFTAGTALFTSLMIINLQLLIEHLPNQKVTSLISPLLPFGLIYILFLSPLHVMRDGELFPTGSMLAAAIVAIFLITWLNYKMVIYFVSKIDVS